MPDTVTDRAAPHAAPADLAVRDWLLSHAHRYAPIVPTAVTTAVIAIAWAALKPHGPRRTAQ